MRVYGNKTSGNSLKVKWVCDRLGISYEWVEIDTIKGETHTEDFLRLNSAGQIPTVQFDDGRTLAQSNAIMRFLARGSDLIPGDAFDAAKMDEWLFWEQYSHEPYIAVCRYRIVYLGMRPSDLDPNLFKRGYAALERMESVLIRQPFFVGSHISLADIALVAYTRVAAGGTFDLDRFPAIRRWISIVEQELGIRTGT